MKHYDFAVIGGGVIGPAVAYGLAREGHSVVILDEGDTAYRAARGNFGLVWVQGKGRNDPHYAAWIKKAAVDFPDFSHELEEVTGIDLSLQNDGGFHFCLSEDEYRDRATLMKQASEKANGSCRFEMFNHEELKKIFPFLGDTVYGASFCNLDSHLNPLRLFRALYEGFLKLGGKYQPNCSVSKIEPSNLGFTIYSTNFEIKAERIVLAAGLGNAQLAPQVGLHAPVKPIKGQVLVSERTEAFIPYPSTFVRQTDEGTILLGASMEEVGMNDSTDVAELSIIAQRAIRIFPNLSSIRIVRTWGALRVMTDDNSPIYDQSENYPGAFVITGHSGVTMASVNAGLVAKSISCGSIPQETVNFSGSRFGNV